MRVNQTITIGGKIKASTVDELLRALDDATIDEPNGNPVKREHLLNGAREYYFWEHYPSATAELTMFCRKYGLTYRIVREGDLEGPEWTEFWRPGMRQPDGMPSDQGEIMIPMGILKAWLRMSETNRKVKLKNYQDITEANIPPLVIVPK